MGPPSLPPEIGWKILLRLLSGTGPKGDILRCHCLELSSPLPPPKQDFLITELKYLSDANSHLPGGFVQSSYYIQPEPTQETIDRYSYLGVPAVCGSEHISIR